MTQPDRIQLDDLTSDQLDALYDDRDQYRADCQKWATAAATAEKVRRAHAADADRYEAGLRDRAEQAEAAITRVRNLRTFAPADAKGPTWAALDLAIRDALDQPQQPTT